jgi:hypothetical protein
MMDFTSMQGRAKGGSPIACHKEGHAEVTVARPLKASPPPTIDGVDKMYQQQVEIDAIPATQLAECVLWHRSNNTSNAAHAGAGWQGHAVEPSTTRTTLPPLTDFSPQASLWRQGPRVEPWVHQWAHQVDAKPTPW